nr:sodium ion-translocating decarboxylase subunit beta [Treponema sp.]
METELNKKNDKYKTFRTCSIICLIALVLSFAGCGLGDSKSSSSASHGSTIVKGSENIPKISVGQFFENIGKNTGIYKIFHTETAEEIAEEKAAEAAKEAATAVDPFAGKKAPGWQSF